MILGMYPKICILSESISSLPFHQEFLFCRDFKTYRGDYINSESAPYFGSINYDFVCKKGRHNTVSRGGGGKGPRLHQATLVVR